MAPIRAVRRAGASYRLFTSVNQAASVLSSGSAMASASTGTLTRRAVRRSSSYAVTVRATASGCAAPEATASTIWIRRRALSTSFRYSSSLRPALASALMNLDCEKLPSSSRKDGSFATASRCMSRVTVRPRLSDSARNTTSRASTPASSGSRPDSRASPMVALGR